MKKAIVTTVLVSAFLAASCAPVYVSEDYDRRAPFNSYKTFAWMTKPEKMPANARSAIERNPLLGKRIQEIAGQILAAKGLTPAEESGADLLLNYYVGFNERVDIAGWGYFYGPRWGFYWPSLGPYDDYYYTEGTLVLDFVDAKTKELVWRGVGDKVLYDYTYGPSTHNFTDEDVRKILDKLLAQYPPTRFAYRER